MEHEHSQQAEIPPRHLRGLTIRSTQGHRREPLCLPPRQPVFECLERVPTVGAERCVETVVEQDDVARANSPQTLNDFRGVLRPPVPR